MVLKFWIGIAVMGFFALVSFTGWPLNTLQAKQIGLSAIFFWLLLLFVLHLKGIRLLLDGDWLDKSMALFVFVLLLSPLLAIWLAPQSALALPQILSGSVAGLLVYLLFSRPALVRAV